MKRWAYAIATDAVIFGCFYLWLDRGFAPAKSFLVFIMWGLAIILIIAGLSMKEVKTKRSSAAYGFYTHLTMAAQIGLCVWSGWVALAIAQFFAWMLVFATVKETKEAQ
ncbi:MAG TPA: hypothetical protein VF783_14005 [Terriglobales bacterium]